MPADLQRGVECVICHARKTSLWGGAIVGDSVLWRGGAVAREFLMREWICVCDWACGSFIVLTWVVMLRIGRGVL